MYEEHALIGDLHTDEYAKLGGYRDKSDHNIVHDIVHGLVSTTTSMVQNSNVVPSPSQV